MPQQFSEKLKKHKGREENLCDFIIPVKPCGFFLSFFYFSFYSSILIQQLSWSYLLPHPFQKPVVSVSVSVSLLLALHVVVLWGVPRHRPAPAVGSVWARGLASGWTGLSAPHRALCLFHLLLSPWFLKDGELPHAKLSQNSLGRF